MRTKFPKFEAHIPKMHWDWYDEDAKKEIEQALTQAENKGIQLGKDIGIKVGFAQGKLAVLKEIMKHKKCKEMHNIDGYWATCLDAVIHEHLKDEWKKMYPKKAERLKSQLSRGELGGVVKGEASAQIQDAKPLIPEVSPRNPERCIKCGYKLKGEGSNIGAYCPNQKCDVDLCDEQKASRGSQKEEKK